MPCFHPLDAYQSIHCDPDTGKRSITFNSFRARDHVPIKLPCGQCVGCRLERSRQWAVRCIHEAQMHSQNCFITLTFSPEALSRRKNPASVDVRDFQLFMKRLRKKYGEGIRFYHCGEYGTICKNCHKSEPYHDCGNWVPWTGRPHYHACLFGFDFLDKTLWNVKNGVPLYISKSLQELWPFGFSTIGEVTFESAAYVARYILKKITGDMAEDRYYDLVTGEAIAREYTTMSRRPGIGSTWFKKYSSDVYPHDNVIVNGKLCKPPKYYDNKLKDMDAWLYDEIKDKRLTAAKQSDNNTPDRLSVREEITEARIKLLPRSVD